MDPFSTKELGDVQNWAEVIEKDMRDIAMTLEFVHRGKELIYVCCSQVDRL